jgi:hypothetical protein
MDMFDDCQLKHSFVEVALIMRCIKAGLYSPDTTLCRKALAVMQRIVLDIRRNNPDLYREFQLWFVKSPNTATMPPEPDYINCPLRACVVALEMHPSMAFQIAELIYNFFRDPGTLGPADIYFHLKTACTDDIFMCYESLSQMMGQLKKIHRFSEKDLIRDSYMISDALNEATDNLSCDMSVKVACTSLLLECWLLEPKVIQPLKRSDGYVSEEDDFDYDAIEAPASPGRVPSSPSPPASPDRPNSQALDQTDLDLDASESDLEEVTDEEEHTQTPEEKEAIK